MNKAAYALKLPQSLKTAAQRLAREDGVSLRLGVHALGVFLFQYQHHSWTF